MTKYNYQDYFVNHLKFRYSSIGINKYEDWIHPQWKLINNIVKFNSKSKILEIGSGIGGIYSLLKKNGDYQGYVGLELDSKACDYSNKYFHTSCFKNISIESLDVNNKYDAVIALEVLEHLNNPFQSVKKIFRLLNTNGFFIASTPYPYKKNVLADKSHRYVLHPSNWYKLLSEQGFRNIKLYPMSFIPYIWKINKHLNFRIPFYVPFKYFISTCLIIAYK